MSGQASSSLAPSTALPCLLSQVIPTGMCYFEQSLRGRTGRREDFGEDMHICMAFIFILLGCGWLGGGQLGHAINIRHSANDAEGVSV